MTAIRSGLKIVKRGTGRRRIKAADGRYIGEVWRPTLRPRAWCLSLDGVLWDVATGEPSTNRSGFTAGAFPRMKDALAAAERYQHLVAAK